MSLPTTPAAYDDCYKLFAKAVESPAGIRYAFPTEFAAKHFQLRLHNARAIQRTQSRRIYPADSPLHDTSEFDYLQVQVRPGHEEWWVYIRPHGIVINPADLEVLDPEEETPAIPHDTPPLQITHASEDIE